MIAGSRTYGIIIINEQIGLVAFMQNLHIFKSEGWYVAEIPSLHVVTRAKTMRGLKSNLKEAVAVAIEGPIEVRKLELSKLNSQKIRA